MLANRTAPGKRNLIGAPINVRATATPSVSRQVAVRPFPHCCSIVDRGMVQRGSEPRR